MLLVLVPPEITEDDALNGGPEVVDCMVVVRVAKIELLTEDMAIEEADDD